MLAALAAYDVAEMKPTGEERSAPLFPKARPHKEGLQELAKGLRTKIHALRDFEQSVVGIQKERPDDRHNYNLRVEQVVGMRHAIMVARTLVKKCALRDGRVIPPWESAEWSDPNSTFEFLYRSGPDVRDAAGILVLGPAVPKSTLLCGAVPCIPPSSHA